MKKKLEKIFYFLNENRNFNHSLQKNFYENSILPYSKTADKVISLLYNVANTQRQPKINYLSEFYQLIYQNKHRLDSFTSFVNLFANMNENNTSFEMLFNYLKKQKGWGNKTSALFVKNIINLHNENYNQELKFWNDVPTENMDNDLVYLPVDSVIISIFNKLQPSKKWNFKNINLLLHSYYSPKEIIIWDDLWFWGFFTQIKGEVHFQWNENKYWTLKESNKDVEIIKETKIKVDEFIKII